MSLSPNWPDSLFIEGQTYRSSGVIHRTPVSVNVRYHNGHGPDYVLKISAFKSTILTLLFWPLLAYMSWREHRIHGKLADIPGIPRRGPRVGMRGYSHEFVPGVTLEQWQRGEPLPDGFFTALTKMLSQIHRKRVFYADLDRKANIIVGDDGQPWLIDYQGSFAFRPRDQLWGPLTNLIFARMKRQDEYHLHKHRRCYGDALQPGEQLLQRSRLSAWWSRYIRLPMRRLRMLCRGERTKTAQSFTDAGDSRSVRQEA